MSRLIRLAAVLPSASPLAGCAGGSRAAMTRAAITASIRSTSRWSSTPITSSTCASSGDARLRGRTATGSRLVPLDRASLWRPHHHRRAARLRRPRRARRRRRGRGRIWPADRATARRSPRARSPPGTSASSSAAPTRQRRGLPRTGATPGIDSPVSTESNYGCATNSNLAAMIANPRRSRPRPGRLCRRDRHVAGQGGRRLSRRRSRPATAAAAGRLHQRQEVTMNAPFHARAPLRFAIPSAAFVCRRGDRRDAAPDRGRAWLVAGKGATRAACATRSRPCRSRRARASCSSTCRNSGDPLNDINALAEVCEPGTVVIAAGQVNDVRLYRDLVASRHPGLSAEALHRPISCATPSPMRS